MQKPCMVVLWKVPCCVCSVAYHWSYRNQSSVMGSFPRLNCCWRTTATASSARWVVMSESRWAGSSSSSSLLWDRRMNKNQLTFIMMCALATIPTSRILHMQGYISLVLYHPAGYLLLPFFKSGIVSLKNFPLPLLNHIHITLTIATTTDHLLACKLLVAKIVIMIVFTRIGTCLYTTGSSGYHSIQMVAVKPVIQQYSR